ncbi:hypothetical protein [Streptomyces sp. Caat 7-52]|uniref:hypothetical protein n=1 Tax=Streptomyces sp. Caat 7-52 TaxID=2949637 RepID=UPI002035E56E|nr:hypothetical protein [Streptomyces sp. Caat 7-52]
MALPPHAPDSHRPTPPREPGPSREPAPPPAITRWTAPAPTSQSTTRPSPSREPDPAPATARRTAPAPHPATERPARVLEPGPPPAITYLAPVAPAPVGAPCESAPAVPAPASRVLVAAVRRLAVGLLLTAAAAGLLGVVHHHRPAPYGDRLLPGGHGEWAVRAQGAAVVGYDRRTGVPRWRYARVGHRPYAVLPARGAAITLWDDGLITDTDGRSVRWHRALPDAAEWLPAQGGTGVLRPLGRGILGVVAPSRVTAYRTADGDLRWVLPARAGCAFRPEGAVRRGAALLLAQPCADAAWTGQLVALDDLGRIAPDRTPLGNDLPARNPGHLDAEKALARPR